MSLKAMAWAWEQRQPATVKMVLLALADCHNAETGQCNPSVKYIGTKAGLKDSSVAASLKTLRDLGLVYIQHNYREDGSLTSSSYKLFVDVPGGPPDMFNSLPGPLSGPGSPLSAPLEPGIEPGNPDTTTKDQNPHFSRSSGYTGGLTAASLYHSPYLVPEWFHTLSQDPRWHGKDPQRFIKAIEKQYSQQVDLNLEAHAAYEWLQTPKGQKKKVLRGFWVNWLKLAASRQEVNGVRLTREVQGQAPGLSALAKYGSRTHPSTPR